MMPPTIAPRFVNSFVPTPGQIIVIKAPEGGIPPRVGMLPGSATCEIWFRSEANGLMTNTGHTVVVYSLLTQAVVTHGDRFGFACWNLGTWYVTGDDCKDTGTTIIPSTNAFTGGFVVDPLELDVATLYGEFTGGFVSFSAPTEVDIPPPE